MNQPLHGRVLATAITALLATHAPAGVAEGIEEVTVTARRTSENLQEVPVAVSAFGAEALANLQADRIDGIAGAVPNLTLVQGRGSSSNANVFIRGIGQPDALQTFDPGVGLYVDDVFMSRIQGGLMGLADIERVEVLRGPQGTLYGKNTIGGAVKLVSRKPSETFRADVQGTVGDYQLREGKLYVSGPLAEGLSGSLAVSRSLRDGYVEGVGADAGRDFNDQDATSARAILRWAPDEDFSLQLSADYTREDVALALGRAEAPLLRTSLVPAGITVLQPAPAGEYDFKGSTSFRGGEGQNLAHKGVSATVEYRLNDLWRLKSITSYRQLNPEFYIDIDATAFELGDAKVFVDQDQRSQEFQFLRESERLRLVSGLYYLREHITSEQVAYADDLFSLLGGAFPFTRFISDELTTTSHAAFANGTLKINEQLNVTVGMRYTREKKEYTRSTNTTGIVTSYVFPLTERTWSAFTPSFTVDWSFAPGRMAYFSLGRGFKNGGFNGRANNVRETKPYNPEFVTTAEAGIKTLSADKRLLANFTVFLNDYTDFQARVGGETAADFPVLNAGKAEIFGAELELLAKPVDGLTLRYNAGFMSAKYKEFIDNRAGVSHARMPFTPRFTQGLGARYEWSFGGGLLSANIDGSYRSSAALSVDNRPGLTQKAYWVANALVGWESADGRFHAAAGMKNLFDEVYKVDAQEFSNVAGIQTAYYGAPRTWSLTLGYRFE